MAILVFEVLLAMMFGFAAHRASICMVRTIAEIVSAGTGYMLASVGKSVLWVWAVTIPIFWLMPALGTGVSGWSLTGYAMLGGLVFGLGAAINGACAFSTMARLVDGDGKMLATVCGFAACTAANTISRRGDGLRDRYAARDVEPQGRDHSRHQRERC